MFAFMLTVAPSNDQPAQAGAGGVRAAGDKAEESYHCDNRQQPERVGEKGSSTNLNKIAASSILFCSGFG